MSEQSTAAQEIGIMVAHRNKKARDPEWHKRVESVIESVAKRLETVTSDDIREEMQRQCVDEEHSDALGHAIRQAVASGYIEPYLVTIPGRGELPMFVKSRLPKSHSKPVTLWRSKVCESVARTSVTVPEYERIASRPADMRLPEEPLDDDLDFLLDDED